MVLNNATVKTDNSDLQDHAYIYWRLLSTDPEAAKDVVLAEKPMISDDSNQTTQKTEDEEYAEAGEQTSSDSPAPIADSGASSPASTVNAQHPAARQPAALLHFFFT
ncbi:hypothetical protein P3S68_020101 [Capsicum galapagoense]